MASSAHHLAEVVRHEVRGHAYRDTRGAIDEQVRNGCRQDGRLCFATVIVGDEVDDVLIEANGHVEGGWRQSGLGVAHRCRTIIGRAEVAVTIDHRQTKRERLGHAHESVVDGGVAVRVEAAHDIADHAGALDVALVGAQAHLRHLEQDAPLYWLETIAGVREGA